MIAKLKHLFEETRLPYIIMAVILICGAGWEVNTIQHENHQANQILWQMHAENNQKIHRNQHKILKYRIQLDALSDEKNAYLNRITMQSILKNAISHGNTKRIRMPNLNKSTEYTHLDSQSLEISNRANNRIAELQSDDHADKQAMHYDHNHDWLTNAWHPQKAPVFQRMVANGGGACLLLILALWAVTCVAKFKDIQLKKKLKDKQDAKRAHQKAERVKREHARKRYIKEFGDDEGFDDSYKD